MLRRALILTALPALALALAMGEDTAQAETPANGARLYQSCSACHGAQGEGLQGWGGPPVAGMPAWYLQSAWTAYHQGWRGTQAGDTLGAEMRGVTKVLTAAEVEAVVAHMAGLPAAEHATTVDGDAEAGQAAYAVCSGCHGPEGQGNEALKAPPLAPLSDWYIVQSMTSYKDGHRGHTSEDSAGSQMKPFGAMLDEQGVRDLAVYISAF